MWLGHEADLKHAYCQPSLHVFFFTSTSALSAALVSGDCFSIHSKHRTCKPRTWKAKASRKLFVFKLIWAVSWFQSQPMLYRVRPCLKQNPKPLNILCDETFIASSPHFCPGHLLTSILCLLEKGRSGVSNTDLVCVISQQNAAF